MKIVIDGKVYDPEVTPVLLVFTDNDKNNILCVSTIFTGIMTQQSEIVCSYLKIINIY